MDYEQKYKEALQRYKDYIGRSRDKKTSMIEDKMGDFIFPEITDSEDEIIRKWIIKYLQYWADHASDKDESNCCKNAIAWLEKQKPFDYEHANIQQKDFAQKLEPKFKVKYAGSEYNVLEIQKIAGVTYYGIEDEPNHIDYVLPDNCEIVRDHSYDVKEKGNPYPTKSVIFSEQKPVEWSEEDENVKENIKKAIRLWFDNDKTIFSFLKNILKL